MGRALHRKKDRSRRPPRNAGAQFRDAVKAIEADDDAAMRRRLDGLARLARARHPRAHSVRAFLVYQPDPPGPRACLHCEDFTTSLAGWELDRGMPPGTVVVVLLPLCDVCAAVYDSGAAPWPAAVESDIRDAVRAELRREGVI
jgi:hypothetical protein